MNKTIRLLFAIIISFIHGNCFSISKNTSVVTQLSSQDLYELILSCGSQLEKENLLDEYQSIVRYCYNLLKQDQVVHETILHIAAEELLRNMQRSCAIRPHNLVSELCDFVMELPGTFTALQELNNTLNEKFFQTFTQVDPTFNITNALNELDEQINNKFNQTWTILGCLEKIPLMIPDGATVDITRPGYYCLINDVNVAAQINIGVVASGADLDNTELIIDLNNKLFTGLINIAGSTSNPVLNVTIKNGIITSSANSIIIASSRNITVENIDFYGPNDGTEVIRMQNSNNVIINTCTFQGYNSNSISIISMRPTCNNVIVTDCKFFFNNNTTIPLSTTSSNSIIGILKTAANQTNNVFITDCDFNNNMATTNQGATVINNAIEMGGNNWHIENCRFLDFNVTDTRVAYSPISGNPTFLTRNALIQNCEIINNSAAFEFIGIGSTLSPVIAHFDSCTLKNIIISHNNHLGVGIFNFQNSIVESCIVMDNTNDNGSGAISTKRAISSPDNFDAGIIQGCKVQGNNNQGSMIAIRNVGSGSGTPRSSIADNIVKSNYNTAGGTDRGIDATTGETIVFGNTMQNQTTNFNAIGPLVLFTPSTGLFASTITTCTRELDNIDVLS